MIITNKILEKIKLYLNIETRTKRKEFADIFCLGYELGNDDGFHNYKSKRYYKNLTDKDISILKCKFCKSSLYDSIEKKYMCCYNCQFKKLEKALKLPPKRLKVCKGG